MIFQKKSGTEQCTVCHTWHPLWFERLHNPTSCQAKKKGQNSRETRQNISLPTGQGRRPAQKINPPRRCQQRQMGSNRASSACLAAKQRGGKGELLWRFEVVASSCPSARMQPPGGTRYKAIGKLWKAEKKNSLHDSLKCFQPLPGGDWRVFSERLIGFGNRYWGGGSSRIG